jgi:hypothetical protein
MTGDRAGGGERHIAGASLLFVVSPAANSTIIFL